MSKDFIKLSLQFQDLLNKEIDKQAKKIYKQQKLDLDNMLNEVARTVLNKEVVEEQLQLSSREKRSLKKKFDSIVKDTVKKEFKEEQITMNEIMTNATIDKYYSNGFLLDIGTSFKLKKLTSKQIKEIVNNTIDSEIWSKRLWKNKKSLEKNLKREVKKLLDGKTSINKVEKIIKDKFNQNAYNSKRLLNTEVARCQNEVNNVFAEEHGVRKQMFMATLDNKTSSICEGYSDRVFDIDDPNKPNIPEKTHVNCRSVLVNLPYDDWKPTTRKDNITKEYVNYSTYKEWKSNQ